MTLGLCSQIDLDFEVQRASKEKPVAGRQRRDAAARRRHHRAAGAGRAGSPAAAKAKDDLDVGAVFAKLKQLGGKAEDKDDE